MIKEINFTYCPHCATPFEKQSEKLLVCPKCNLHYYLNPKPTNSIILLNKQSEILFVIRKHEPKKGMLDLPGGFVDPNETFEESMIREAQEELGITITTFGYVGSFVDEYEHGNVSSSTICVLYEGSLPEGAVITPSDDVADYRFIAPGDIPYEDMAFDGMKKGLKKFLNKEFKSYE